MRYFETKSTVRASVAAVAKIMSFYHIKSLLYYFTTSFYNIYQMFYIFTTSFKYYFLILILKPGDCSHRWGLGTIATDVKMPVLYATDVTNLKTQNLGTEEKEE